MVSLSLVHVYVYSILQNMMERNVLEELEQGTLGQLLQQQETTPTKHQEAPPTTQHQQKQQVEEDDDVSSGVCGSPFHFTLTGSPFHSRI